MRTGIVVEVTAADRDRLEAIVADRNSPQKHVWRARIVLATADGLGTMAVMQAAGKSKTAVWRWQERFSPLIPSCRSCAAPHALLRASLWSIPATADRPL